MKTFRLPGTRCSSSFRSSHFRRTRPISRSFPPRSTAYSTSMSSPPRPSDRRAGCTTARSTPPSSPRPKSQGRPGHRPVRHRIRQANRSGLGYEVSSRTRRRSHFASRTTPGRPTTACCSSSPTQRRSGVSTRAATTGYSTSHRGKLQNSAATHRSRPSCSRSSRPTRKRSLRPRQQHLCAGSLHLRRARAHHRRLGHPHQRHL